MHNRFEKPVASRTPGLRLAVLVSAAALLLSFLTAGQGLRAAPLEKEACAALKEEAGHLAHSGAKGNMARGPERARANLLPEKMAQIARLIEVEQHIAFRCPRPKPPLERVEKEEAATAKAAENEIEGKARPRPRAVLTQPPQAGQAVTGPRPKVSPSPGENGTSSPPRPAADGAEARVAPKPKPRPKPKVDDAYSPALSGAQPTGGLDAQAAEPKPRPRPPAVPAPPAQGLAKAPPRPVQ